MHRTLFSFDKPLTVKKENYGVTVSSSSACPFIGILVTALEVHDHSLLPSTSYFLQGKVKRTLTQLSPPLRFPGDKNVHRLLTTASTLIGKCLPPFLSYRSPFCKSPLRLSISLNRGKKENYKVKSHSNEMGLLRHSPVLSLPMVCGNMDSSPYCLQ